MWQKCDVDVIVLLCECNKIAIGINKNCDVVVYCITRKANSPYVKTIIYFTTDKEKIKEVRRGVFDEKMLKTLDRKEILV